jgi:hypothetical protein
MSKPSKLNLADLRIGDLILYKNGRSFLASLIRWGTNSPYSHVLMYLGKDQFIESNFSFWPWVKSWLRLGNGYHDGVRIIDLQELRRRKGDHDVFQTSYFQTQERQEELITIANKMILKRPRYDLLGLLWQAVVAARLKFLRRKTNWEVHDRTKYYCSELTRHLELKAGLSNPDNLAPENTTPQTEAAREDTKFVGTIFRGHDKRSTSFK